MSKRTRFSAKTSVVTRCRTGPAIRRNGWRRSRRRWRRDAKLAAEEERRIEAEKQQQRNAAGHKKPGKPAAPLPDEPDPKAQRNFTDPDSRIMKSKEGFVQAYNVQAAVDA